MVFFFLIFIEGISIDVVEPWSPGTIEDDLDAKSCVVNQGQL